MSTLRQDVTRNEWVILAPQRAGRPHRPDPRRRPELPERDAACPFCPGNEAMTPPEIARRPAEGAWEQRVFSNLYPALEEGAGTARVLQDGFREMAGAGAHEVVVETPVHNERMEWMPLDRVAGVIATWRDRYLELTRLPRTRAVVVFKNFGEGAGTSLLHPHSQIVAVPVFPPDALRRYAVATRYFDDTGRCVYEELRDTELHAGDRLIAERRHFVAVAPFASRVPWETWVLPRSRQSALGQLEDSQVSDLAALVKDILRALRLAAGDPDFNLVVQSAPAEEEAKPFFLWHLQLLPRTTTPAGFELGSGMSINTMSPEEAAAGLRDAMARPVESPGRAR